MEGRLDASRRVLFSLGSVETSFTLLSLQAGLLTFPSLLYLPDNVVSGVIRADLINGDYSCRYSSGLSPDSLTSGDISRQIAYSAANIDIIKQTTKEKAKKIGLPLLIYRTWNSCGVTPVSFLKVVWK